MLPPARLALEVQQAGRRWAHETANQNCQAQAALQAIRVTKPRGISEWGLMNWGAGPRDEAE
jgi:hypothetical protein